MIKIKTVSAKNFLSIGNVTQAVNFDTNELTLVVGENLDLAGTDAAARNGCGKTAIINALSYALFGNAISNIKKDNLINRVNGKGMLVTIEFEKDGIDYKIERGRKPGVMKLWVSGKEKTVTDDAQGDSRETQTEIDKIIGMSHDMFKHIVAMNTYTEPFLSLRANDQRVIIEQLLGITMLSEKADLLREQIRLTKESISQEEFKIAAITDANKRIQEQIENLKRRQRLWVKKHNDDVNALASQLENLIIIDIDKEIALHKEHAEYKEKLAAWNSINNEIKKLTSDIKREEKLVASLTQQINDLNEHKCYACGQSFHDEQHSEVLAKKRSELETAQRNVEEYASQKKVLEDNLIDPGELPENTSYANHEDAIHHRSTVDNLEAAISKKLEEPDPYSEQITEMEQSGIQEVSYDKINELTLYREHQEFLLKLLTNKDSFIRKRIIDQNLSYLNSRLASYLDKTGLPHSVEFNNDLSVTITELGKDLDFDNLSRGERNRLIISLSWAFRDVWESLYHPINLLFIDELLDFGMDQSGVEGALVVLKKMARDNKKSVWLISHREDLLTRVNRILRVTKEAGYTSYSPDIEFT